MVSSLSCQSLPLICYDLLYVHPLLLTPFSLPAIASFLYTSLDQNSLQELSIYVSFISSFLNHLKYTLIRLPFLELHQNSCFQHLPCMQPNGQSSVLNDKPCHPSLFLLLAHGLLLLSIPLQVSRATECSHLFVL